MAQAADDRCSSFEFEDVSTPESVLLDLKFPIFDGTSVLQTVRETPALMHLPVVIFTSSRHPLDRIRCVELGATEYVEKPTDWRTWQNTFRRIVRQHVPGAEADTEDE